MRAHEFIFEEDNITESIDNPELLKWFGKSKIVDENGNPKVVYHGTSADFEIFQKPEMNRMADRSAVGFWFTSSKEDAMSYGKNLKQVILKMVKPRRITRRKLDELAVSYPLQQVMEKLKAGGCDGLIIEAIKPDPIMEEKGMPEQYVVFSADQIKNAP